MPISKDAAETVSDTIESVYKDVDYIAILARDTMASVSESAGLLDEVASMLEDVESKISESVTVLPPDTLAGEVRDVYAGIEDVVEHAHALCEAVAVVERESHLSTYLAEVRMAIDVLYDAIDTEG